MPTLKRDGASDATVATAKRPRSNKTVHDTQQPPFTADLNLVGSMLSETEWRRNRDRLEELVTQYDGVRLLVEGIRKHWSDLRFDFDVRVVTRQLLRSNQTVFQANRHIMWTQLKNSLASIKNWRRLGSWKESRRISGLMPFLPLYEELQALRFLDTTDSFFPADLIKRLAEVNFDWYIQRKGRDGIAGHEIDEYPVHPFWRGIPLSDPAWRNSNMQKPTVIAEIPFDDDLERLIRTLGSKPKPSGPKEPSSKQQLSLPPTSSIEASSAGKQEYIASIKSLQHDIDSLTANINGSSLECQLAMKKLHSRLDSFQKSINEIGSRVTVVESSTASAVTRIQGLETSSNQAPNPNAKKLFDNRVTTLANHRIAHHSRLAALEMKNETLEQRLAIMSKKLESLENQRAAELAISKAQLSWVPAEVQADIVARLQMIKAEQRRAEVNKAREHLAVIPAEMRVGVISKLQSIEDVGLWEDGVGMVRMHLGFGEVQDKLVRDQINSYIKAYMTVLMELRYMDGDGRWQDGERRFVLTEQDLEDWP
ncbi:hypothetical protein QBC40DRAFT_352224 [Triangularia verruculosa]|uniref:Uncharacterized protein n=1 Tax=Triangularia verruculosa TaxID=2587418 RepID=A0AAN6XDM3_9PEZI|nr:hypothetical protein QBC40DRAFT_352224 [Triangularia verruculosa]